MWGENIIILPKIGGVGFNATMLSFKIIDWVFLGEGIENNNNVF